jgi:glutathione synthase/RimK-type ligase-like ATP-grasp enzyme
MLVMSLAVRWCNHPGKSADAAYKPTQLAAFRDCGLTVPRTLITNRADDVLSFVERVGQVVCKAIVSEVVRTTGRSQVVYTHLLTDDDLADLREVHHTAYLFQEYVPKAFEVRLTVVGNEFFAAKIDTSSATSMQVDTTRTFMSLSTPQRRSVQRSPRT